MKANKALIKKQLNKKVVYAFVDGACRGNPGKGGWGVVLVEQDSQTKHCFQGKKLHTTNNRMELTAALEALHAVSSVACGAAITMVTDSEYVKRGVTEWSAAWIKKNWKTAAGKPVKNQDLWKLLLEELRYHQVVWQWVKGHSGHPGNEEADALARAAIDA